MKLTKKSKAKVIAYIMQIQKNDPTWITYNPVEVSLQFTLTWRDSVTIARLCGYRTKKYRILNKVGRNVTIRLVREALDNYITYMRSTEAKDEVALKTGSDDTAFQNREVL